MTLYSDFPVQRTRQIVADLAAVVGIVAFVVLGVTVHGLVMSLQAVGMRLTDAGTSFSTTMSEISDRLGDVPLIGSGIRGPFDEASDAGSSLEAFGRAQQDATAQLATGLGLSLALVPVLTILLVWLIPRIRFARRAAWARTAAASPAGIDLLAHRALTNRRLPLIAAVHPDAAGAWRRGDAAVIGDLATLELRASGVRMP